MTGGLGQRSGSTGSLQWLQIQQQHQLNPVISTFSPPIIVRKVNKAGNSPSARDRLGVWICRIVGRKKAGMSLLFLVSVFVFISFLFTFNKGEDGLVSEVTGIQSSRFPERPIADRFNNLDRRFVSNNSANLEISPRIKNNDSVIVRLIFQNQSRIHPPVAKTEYRSRIHPPVAKAEYQSRIHPPVAKTEYQSRIHPPVAKAENQSRIHPPVAKAEYQSRIHPPVAKAEYQSRIHPPVAKAENQSRIHPPVAKAEYQSGIHPPVAKAENQSRIRPPVAKADPSLPPGHPCQHFTLPPPPADKKRTGPRPCPVCYLPVEQAIKLMPAIPSATLVKNLTYVTEVTSAVPTQGSRGSDFGGYPTLKQRDDYFNLQESMHVHCGFVKGSTPGNATGFDFDKEDIFDMHQCRGIVVASAVFGNYDEIQQPKNISERSKSDICFFMFVDETTESFLRKSAALGSSKMIGLWRVVVVHNLPYSDARRNGKIPKLLLHRLFPNVRYSLWIDGKLELVVDPYQILERFLWRTNDNFAISRHYRRFDVFDEAEANKAAGKYDNASIDAQVEFYRKEGLTHYSSSKLPITSDVPEGCVIIREHTPITNLFTCLWFDEVDRFTSRDQISFAIVRDKIMARLNWRVNMFLDCERRNFVVQAYHRDVLEKRISRMTPPPLPKVEPRRIMPPPLPKVEPSRMMPPPLPKVEPSRISLDEPSRKSSDDKVPDKVPRSSGRKGSSRHGRDKRSANARHRKAKIGSKVAESS